MPRSKVYTPEELHARKLQSQAKYREKHVQKARDSASAFYYANKDRINAHRREVRAQKKLEKKSMPPVRDIETNTPPVSA